MILYPLCEGNTDVTAHSVSSSRVFQRDQIEVCSSCIIRLTCWVPHWLPVQVTVFFPDPSAKPMVKTATVYEDTCKERTRKASKPQTNDRMCLLTRLSVRMLSPIHT